MLEIVQHISESIINSFDTLEMTESNPTMFNPPRDVHKLVMFLPWVHESLQLIFSNARLVHSELKNAEQQANEFRGKTDQRINELQAELSRDKSMLAKMQGEYKDKLETFKADKIQIV